MEYSNAEIAEVLEKVADAWESERLGWRQHSTFTYKANRYEISWDNIAAACALGGIMLEAGNGGMTSLRAAVVDKLARSLHPSDLRASISQWNDAYGRTKQEVIDKFKEVAKDLRNADN